MVGITSMENLAAGLNLPLLILVALCYGWMIVSYGVMFWRTRRSYALIKMVLWTMYGLVAGWQTNYLTTLDWLDRLIAVRNWLWLGLAILSQIIYTAAPAVVLYLRWVGRATEPGYAHSRDFLLLRRPAPTEHPFPAAGAKVDIWGFVRKLPKIIALSIAIMLGFFLLTKLIFDFGPFF